MTRPKSKPYYLMVAAAMVDKTFDLEEDNGGWTTVHELIALYMLRDFSERDTHVLLDSYVGMVKRNFYQAKDYLETEQKIPVYLIKGIEKKNTRNLTVVTIDPDYNDARNENYSRILRNIQEGVKTFSKSAKISHPERFKEIERRNKNYITMIEDQKEQVK